MFVNRPSSNFKSLRVCHCTCIDFISGLLLHLRNFIIEVVGRFWGYTKHILADVGPDDIIADSLVCTCGFFNRYFS